MLLMIDNYDSFTFNLVQYFQMLGAEVRVERNDALTVDQIEALAPRHIVISPGPGTPDQAGISLELIARLGPRIPILGVCLGHQSIGQVYGGNVVRAGQIMHGKTSTIRHRGQGVFSGLPDGFQATRSISREPATKHIPVILVTTKDQETDRMWGMRQGARAYLTKPFSEEELAEVILAHIGSGEGPSAA